MYINTYIGLNTTKSVGIILTTSYISKVVNNPGVEIKDQCQTFLPGKDIMSAVVELLPRYRARKTDIQTDTHAHIQAYTCADEHKHPGA